VSLNAATVYVNQRWVKIACHAHQTVAVNRPVQPNASTAAVMVTAFILLDVKTRDAQKKAGCAATQCQYPIIVVEMVSARELKIT
jgi:hypothetical protein